jgi:hypothetical protein
MPCRAVTCCAVLCVCLTQVLRNREELEYEIELQPLQTLVPVHKYDQLPSYFIHAGGCLAVWPSRIPPTLTYSGGRVLICLSQPNYCCCHVGCDIAVVRCWLYAGCRPCVCAPEPALLARNVLTTGSLAAHHFPLTPVVLLTNSLQTESQWLSCWVQALCLCP